MSRVIAYCKFNEFCCPQAIVVLLRVMLGVKLYA